MSRGSRIQTTVIGSYPKPTYLKIPDLFKEPSMEMIAKKYNTIVADEGITELINRAESEVLKEQVDLGIDIITDGEMRRENFVYYLLRHMKGFDFVNLTKIELETEEVPQAVPTVVGTIDIDLTDASKLASEWRKSQNSSEVPVKYTIPGPMTVIECTADSFYSDSEKLSEDLVRVIQIIIKHLVNTGCKHIQVDEPLFARITSKALQYGIRHAALCFQDVGPEVTNILHICCGYPRYCGDEGYVKADKSSYHTLAKHIEEAGFDTVSIEDAHCHNDLSFLKTFTKTNVILGCVAIARIRVETVDEIQGRIREALKYIPVERLQIAPDCGLGFLPHDVLVKKLANMVSAASTFNSAS